MAPRFIIVTDFGTFTEGESLDGAGLPGVIAGRTPTAYEIDGDWVSIELSGDYEISLPESRVRYAIDTPDA